MKYTVTIHQVSCPKACQTSVLLSVSVLPLEGYRTLASSACYKFLGDIYLKLYKDCPLYKNRVRNFPRLHHSLIQRSLETQVFISLSPVLYSEQEIPSQAFLLPNSLNLTNRQDFLVAALGITHSLYYHFVFHLLLQIVTAKTFSEIEVHSVVINTCCHFVPINNLLAESLSHPRPSRLL